MIEINLIPDVKRELLEAQRMRNTVITVAIITSIAVGAVVILLAFYIYAVQGARSAYLDSKIDEKGQQLSKVDDLSKILTIQNQLAKISEYNDQKIVTSRIFDAMSAITSTGNEPVSFSQISISPGGATTDDTEAALSEGAGGMLLFEGQTASYTSMEAFKKTIENTSIVVQDSDGELIPLASNINTGEVSYGEDATGNKVVRFTITFEYAEALFSTPSNKTVSFKRTINGNVTDSYLGIPRFTERAKDIEEGTE